MSPTGRSLVYLRQCGFVASIVERWLPLIEKRRDCFGVGDVLAASALHREIWLVPATSSSNVSAWVAKAQRSAELLQWLKSGGKFVVHGWQQRGGRWFFRQVELRAGDVAPEIVAGAKRRRRGDRQKLLFDGTA
jgi:hypothetical protein